MPVRRQTRRSSGNFDFWRYWTLARAYFDLVVLCVGLACSLFLVINSMTNLSHYIKLVEWYSYYFDWIDGEPELTEEQKQTCACARLVADVVAVLMVSVAMKALLDERNAALIKAATGERRYVIIARRLTTAWRNVRSVIVAYIVIAIYLKRGTPTPDIVFCGVVVWYGIGVYTIYIFTKLGYYWEH